MQLKGGILRKASCKDEKSSTLTSERKHPNVYRRGLRTARHNTTRVRPCPPVTVTTWVPKHRAYCNPTWVRRRLLTSPRDLRRWCSMTGPSPVTTPIIPAEDSRGNLAALDFPTAGSADTHNTLSAVFSPAAVSGNPCQC